MVTASVSQLFAQSLAPSDTSSTEGLRFPIREQNNYPFSTSGLSSPLYLRPPSNVEQNIEYDPETKRYVFSEKVGQLDYRPPASMSFEQYREYNAKKSQSDYWREKALEESGAGPSFLKNLRLGNQAVDKVFGSDVINITPKGSAELIFGYTINTNDNPRIPVKNQRNGSFLFKQKIMMNVTGSIGDKFEVGLNYNTEATFDFENKTKLEYAGKEDEIIKKIEAGDVSFSVPGSLITGSQSLFGLKTEMQFGHLTVTSVVSHQRGESSSINVQGGAQLTEFEVDAHEYDANRHFFLGHFFRDNYNEWLKNLPYIESQVQIQQIEVWVLNRQSNYEEVRNVVALMDLGEGLNEDGEPNYFAVDLIDAIQRTNPPASNNNNSLYSSLARSSGIRNFDNITSFLESFSGGQFQVGRDYNKLNSARPLSDREYDLNRELGYISLNSPLRNDEVLAVAYTYTYRGKTYQVGELSNDPSDGTLIVKLLKGETPSPKYPNWDLMMKNVYAIGAYQVSAENFVLNVLYRNDKTGVPVNYLSEANESSISPNVQKTPLLEVVRLDNLDSRNEPNPDGIFDYVEGTTINSRNGRVFFPVLEPFGSDLYNAIIEDAPDQVLAENTAEKYVFQELYDSTKTKAEQIAEKNKFMLKGVYQSSSSSEIQLNAMNVPRGSVVVTAGGRTLDENVDYTVDYTLGRVRIINQGLLESGTPIRISLESNSLFNIQTKTLLGTHLDYRFSENFNIGATILNLTERPLTQKVNMGDEPISNTIWGLNTSYRTESQFLTTLIDKLPLIETKQPSSIMLEGEFAQLIPGQSKAIGEGGVAYIDDFEAAQIKMEMKTFPSWYFASPPKENPTFDKFSGDELSLGYGRAKFSWFVIDPLFYRETGLNPGGAGIEADKNSHYGRRIREKEIFPQKESDIPGENFLSILNMAFYPQIRGPYNYDPSLTEEGTLISPRDRWGGIMREIINSDFETSNVEFIEFWMLDPYLEDSLHSGGDLYIHLGNISEDILPDGRKSYESGLPVDDTELGGIDIKPWGRVPKRDQSYNNNFALDEGRAAQDVGLDGLNDANEADHFQSFLDNLDANIRAEVAQDPSADNFKYYLDDSYDDVEAGIYERYWNYNNLEGNSPVTASGQDYTPSSSNEPDIEDINGDNTMNENERYFEYRVSLRPEDLQNVGENFIVDQIIYEDPKQQFNKPARWIQFRIPLGEWESKMKDIEDFKSIRFMRLLLSDFDHEVKLRFATLDLVRGDWRRYNYDISETNPTTNIQQDQGDFEVSAVNIEENSKKSPVNYVLPPGIDRVIDPGNPQVAHLNEQSILLKVKNLADGDARSVFKNVQLDLRQYQKMKMFIHAEELPDLEGNLQDYELSAFIRIGSDYLNNYYEIEVPLSITPEKPQTNYQNDDKDDREIVWPLENTIEMVLNDLVDLKRERNEKVRQDPQNYSIQSIYTSYIPVGVDGETKYNTIKVKGNPNFGNIRQIMLGVRNPGDFTSYERTNDGLPKSAEVWFNELRLTDFNNRGGWAANGRMQAQLADLGVVNVAGSRSTPGFGSIEQSVEERSMEEINQIDVSSNLELGKFFPEKAKVSIPLYVGASKTIINPEYFPRDPDIKFQDVLDEAKTEAERDSLKTISQDYTSRASINITNMRWNKKFKKVNIISPSNLSATVGYTQTLARNYSTEYNNLWKYNASINYTYNTRPKNIQPLRKSRKLRKPAFRIIRDFNFNPYPSRFSFGTDLNRSYQEIKLRNVYEDIDLIIDPTVNKDFVWNRKYQFKWDLTRALKFDYTANAAARIDEPIGQQDLFIANNEQWKQEVWQSIQDGGRIMKFNQKMDLNYNVPINKIPFFNWTSLNTSYSATYDWTRGEIVPGRELGNTIKNSNTIKASSNLNLRAFYNKLSYLKKLDAKYKKSPENRRKPEDINYKEVVYEKRTFFRKDEPRNINHKLKTERVTVTATDSEGNEVDVDVEIISENRIAVTAAEDLLGVTVVVVGKIPRGENPIVFLGENTIRLITGFKSVNLSWTQTSGSLMPGYLPGTQYFGMDFDNFDGAPGWPFIMGMQDPNLVYRGIDDSWLTSEPTFSKPFEYNKREDISLRANYEPFDGLRIDFTANRSYAEYNEQLFFADSSGIGNYQNSAQRYYVDNMYKGGSFSISVISIATAFENPSAENNYNSKAFEMLKKNRSIISSRRYQERVNNFDDYGKAVYHANAEGFYDGYGPTSQDVLVPAFLSAYTGIDPQNVTLESFFWTMMPNWRVSFDGLSNLKIVKKYMKSLVLDHVYKSTYSIGSYGANVNYFDQYSSDVFSSTSSGVRGLLRDSEQDFLSQYQFNSVAIKEQLSPLIGFNMTWHNSLLTKFELGRTRTVTLSMNNNQVNETRNKDYTIGAGYRFKEVPFTITSGGTRKQIKSDLNVRFDLSIRNNITIIRFLDRDPEFDREYNLTTGGKKTIIGVTADYVINDNFNIQFFFDRDLNTPFTSERYRTSETSFGFSLRLTL